MHKEIVQQGLAHFEVRSMDLASVHFRVSYRILSWGGGGGIQDGSIVIVARKSTLTHA